MCFTIAGNVNQVMAFKTRQRNIHPPVGHDGVLQTTSGVDINAPEVSATSIGKNIMPATTYLCLVANILLNLVTVHDNQMS